MILNTDRISALSCCVRVQTWSGQELLSVWICFRRVWDGTQAGRRGLWEVGRGMFPFLPRGSHAKNLRQESVCVDNRHKCRAAVGASVRRVNVCFTPVCESGRLTGGEDRPSSSEKLPVFMSVWRIASHHKDNRRMTMCVFFAANPRGKRLVWFCKHSCLRPVSHQRLVLTESF